VITGLRCTHSCDIPQVMIGADFKNIAFFCLEYALPQSKNDQVDPHKPTPAAGFRLKLLLGIFFVLGVCFLSAIAFDKTVSEQLMRWPAPERAFFATLARMGESDWMLIPTLCIWLLSQIGNRLPLSYSMRWLVRASGAMTGFIFLTVGLPGAVAAILKVAIGRARPMLIEDVGVLHFTPFAGDWRFAGFPSGHATTAFALAWSLYFLFGWRVTIVFFGAFLLALSRIVDGAHYLSDVIAGICLGSFGAFWVLGTYKKRSKIFRDKQKGQQNRMLQPFKRAFKRIKR